MGWLEIGLCIAIVIVLIMIYIHWNKRGSYNYQNYNSQGYPDNDTVASGKYRPYDRSILRYIFPV